MTLSKLPDELKSGRVLVATAAKENAGLYTFPGLDDDYRIVTRAGTVTRGNGETVPAPPSGIWSWFTNAAGERIADGADPDEQDEQDDEETNESFLSTPSSLTSGDEAVEELKTNASTADGDETKTSNELDCFDCGAATRKLSHAHTTGWPIETLCCPCTLKRGYSCPLEDIAA